MSISSPDVREHDPNRHVRCRRSRCCMSQISIRVANRSRKSIRHRSDIWLVRHQIRTASPEPTSPISSHRSCDEPVLLFVLHPDRDDGVERHGGCNLHARSVCARRANQLPAIVRLPSRPTTTRVQRSPSGICATRAESRTQPDAGVRVTVMRAPLVLSVAAIVRAVGWGRGLRCGEERFNGTLRRGLPGEHAAARGERHHDRGSGEEMAGAAPRETPVGSAGSPAGALGRRGVDRRSAPRTVRT
jgi:hypothetical protein